MSGNDEGWFVTNAAPINSSHDVVLQTLNQWRPVIRRGASRPTFYAEDAFAGTEEAWTKVPVIYTKKGHSPTRFTDDPRKALDECEGRIVGSFVNPVIDKAGTTKFAGTVDIFDPEVEKLHAEGKLVLSSGFKCEFDAAGRLVGKVIPDHIIVFEPTPLLRPQDHGAMFLNAAGPGSSLLDKFERLVTSFRDAIFHNAVGPLFAEDSWDNEKIELLATIRAAEGIDPGNSSVWLHIEAIFPESVVYGISEGESDRLYRREYTNGPGGISLGDATPVKVAYVPVEEPVPPLPPVNGVNAPGGLDLEPGLQRWALVGNAASDNPAMNAGDTVRANGGSETMTEKTSNPAAEVAALSATVGEREKQIENLSATITAYETRIKALEDAAAKGKQAEIDARWEQVKKEALLPADYHKPEDEEALKAKFLENPTDFFMNAIAHKRAPDRKSEGTQFVGNAAGDGEPDPEKECASIVSELRAMRGR